MAFAWGGVQQYLDQEREERLIREERLQKRKDAIFQTMLPELAKRRAMNKSLVQEQKKYQSWFRNRLAEGDVDENTVDAYANIASSNPEMAKTLISRIEEVEKSTNSRVSGRDLIRLSNVIEQTKPEDQSLEEWTSYAASQLTPRANGSIDMDTTLQKILSAESETDLYDVQVDLMSTLSGGPSVSFQPDINRPSFLGISPADAKAYREQLLEASLTAYQLELDELEQAAVRDPSLEEDPEFQQRRMRLQRYGKMENPEGIILQEYAPKLGPKFAEQDPSFGRWFETFMKQTNPEPTQAPVDLQEAIRMLRADPSLLNFFIETYGEENVPEDLRGI